MLPLYRAGYSLLLGREGQNPFEDWFGSLDPVARAKVTVAIARLGQCNLSKRQGRRRRRAGISDQFRAGISGYVGRDGETVVILLTGGTRRRQQRDITAAIEMRRNYRQR